MNQIPAQLLPKALEKKILLSKLGKILVEHDRKSAMYIPTLIFIKTYIPPIKFYNEHLKFERKIAQVKFPQVTIFDLELKELEKFESGMLTAEDILKKILDANKNLGGEANNDIIA